MDLRAYSYSCHLPKWLPTKFANKCKLCGETQSKGTRILYFPRWNGKAKTGAILCRACGEAHLALRDDGEAIEN
jgi:ribosomal protein S14